MVVAVLFSLLLMVMDHRLHYLEPVRSALAVTVYPLHYLASLPVRVSDWIGETLNTREELQQSNEAYRQENLRLKGKLQRFEALEAENIRLRDLLDSSLKVGDQVLVAELISIDLDPYKQQVLIDRGSSSGVFLGQPVLDANAVLGQVIHVSPMTATVLMITDPAHALPVQVNRNGLRTIANGTGRINELELPHLPNNADIREGDLLVTSGLGGHFPPGYPVARVTQVIREPGQPFARVLATPNAHLERVREVLLVRTLPSLLNGKNGSESGSESGSEALP
jgi:rod shape-determining protein MreC